VTITAADLLHQMKARDDHNVGVVTMIVNDRTKLLERLCACWPNVALCLEGDTSPEEVCPEDTPATHRERWLWARVEPEPESVWAEVAGMPDAPHVRRAMRTLQKIGAVFPDGTLSKYVWRYLRAQAKDAGTVNDEMELVQPL
jgi:hypothetical protein